MRHVSRCVMEQIMNHDNLENLVSGKVVAAIGCRSEFEALVIEPWNLSHLHGNCRQLKCFVHGVGGTH